MRLRWILGSLIASSLWIAFSAMAGEAVVEDAIAVPSAAGGYNFSVTIRHDDEGWSHYADKWIVLSPDGKTILAERVLFHPHVDEQPFTRGIRAVLVPEEFKTVLIRAHDRKHGWSTKDYEVTLPDR